MGTALALAFSAAGHEILAMVSRHSRRAKVSASLVGKNVRAFSSTQLGALPHSDILLIATPDDVLEQVGGQLAESLDSTGVVALHTSGALSSNVLRPMKLSGFSTGSLHPLVSVSQPQSGAENLRTAFFCIEGDRTAKRVARALVADIGGQSFSIAADHKALYHAAAVMTAGHVVALFDVANEMLEQCGLDAATASKVLAPLIKSAVGNLAGSTPDQALTGTFSRGDLATVIEHLKALDHPQLKTALAVYRLLGKRSLDLARRRGMDAELVERIEKILVAPR